MHKVPCMHDFGQKGYSTKKLCGIVITVITVITSNY